jgi:aryl-alcohol dehydrogenase-like predicted oxidoreductase
MYFFTHENIKRTNAFLEKIKPLAEEKKATLGQLVLRWTLDQPGITIALAGARNAKQAVENAKAASIELNMDEVDQLNNHLKSLEILKS